MPNVTLRLPLAAAFAFAASTAFAGNACDFYAGAGYSGEKFTLYKGHVLATQPLNPQLTSTLAAGQDYQEFMDPRWAGRVVSVRVQAGCRAAMSDGTTEYGISNDTANVGAHNAIAYACVCQ